MQVADFIVLFGPGFENGAQYAYFKLPVSGEADVRDARLEDLTGDGKAELILHLKQRLARGVVEIAQVISLLRGAPQSLFIAVVRDEQPDGFVQARWNIKPGEQNDLPAIELRPDKVYGLNRNNFRPQPSSGAEPILTPWGPVLDRLYRWDGQRFAIANETRNPEAVAAPTQVADEECGCAEESAKNAPFNLDAIVTAFRQAARIPDSVRPRFAQKADLGEDKTPETIMVLGNILLVAGPHFRGGTSYFYSAVPAQTPDDILDLSTGDLTGDGRAEVIIRIRQQLGDLSRELLLVQQFNDGSFSRLLAAEVKREQGGNDIENSVRLLRAGRQLALEISPGRAKGWSSDNFPYLLSSTDGIEPLLLPWKEKPVRYRFDGQRLVR